LQTLFEFVLIAKVCKNALKPFFNIKRIKKIKKHQKNMPACPAAQGPISQSRLSSKTTAIISHDLGIACYFLTPYILAKHV
jgi:hypothetical protein